MSFQARLASEYSSIFSSGLLAPPRASLDVDRTPTSSPAPSPCASPALPAALAPGSPFAMSLDPIGERATTPTPSTYRPLAPPSPHTPAFRRNENMAPTARGAPPPMRRRKSSLSLATSPMPMLKNRPSFLLRARSGSASSSLAVPDLTSGPMTAPLMPSFIRHGSEGSVNATGLMGRMRSGSLGGAIRAGARRLVRKPSKAPPSVPLPPTPADGQSDAALLQPASALAFGNPFSAPGGPALRRPLARRAQTSVDFASIPEHNHNSLAPTEPEDIEMGN